MDGIRWLAAVVALGVQAASLPRDAPLVFVSNERSGTITVIDGQTDQVLQTISVGARPRGIQTSPDGRTLYVALSDNSSRVQGSGDAVAAIDISTRRVVARFEAGSDPEQFAVSPDGRRLIAANEDAGTASLTDIARHAVVATFAVGIEPEGVAISPDGRWAYVTAETSNTVTVVDVRRSEVVSSFMVDPRPRAAAFSPGGSTAYVTTEIGGSVAVVDALRHRVRKVVPLPGGAKPVGVVVSPDGKRVYIAGGQGNRVIVLTRSGEIAGSVPVGKRPWNLALTADGRKLYTANGASNDVSVIDTESLKVIRTIQAGDGPWGVAVASRPSRSHTEALPKPK
jgi:PQQ-dependent catabolism-associated beta-propeller protein